MTENNFNKLIELFDLIRLGMLNKYSIYDFLDLVKEDDCFTYEVVKDYPPFDKIDINVNIQFGEIYSFATIKNGNPLGTTVVYKALDKLYTYFVSYETMILTGWQPHNPNMIVSIPKG